MRNNYIGKKLQQMFVWTNSARARIWHRDNNNDTNGEEGKLYKGRHDAQGIILLWMPDLKYSAVLQSIIIHTVWCLVDLPFLFKRVSNSGKKNYKQLWRRLSNKRKMFTSWLEQYQNFCAVRCRSEISGSIYLYFRYWNTVLNTVLYFNTET